jgi:hypothetical protein
MIGMAFEFAAYYLWIAADGKRHLLANLGCMARHTMPVLVWLSSYGNETCLEVLTCNRFRDRV